MIFNQTLHWVLFLFHILSLKTTFVQIKVIKMLKSALVYIVICFIALGNLSAQSFKKGTFLVGLSEGSTTANYTTRDFNKSNIQTIYKSEVDGERDPLCIEFGLTNKWGIGLSSGTDIFKVNPSRYYGFRLPNNEPIKVSTSELTVDINYHYFINKKLDLSAYSSVGLFSLAYKGQISDVSYNHQSSGAIVRVGTKARYYFCKRIGVMGILSTYSGTASAKGNKENTVGKNTATTITGRALEFGLCFRFF